MKFLIIFTDHFTTKRRTITALDRAAAAQYAECQLKLWQIRDDSVTFRIEEIEE